MHATSSPRVGYKYQVRNSPIDNVFVVQHGCGKPNANRVRKAWRMERVTVPGMTIASSAQQVCMGRTVIKFDDSIFMSFSLNKSVMYVLTHVLRTMA